MLLTALPRSNAEQAAIEEADMQRRSIMSLSGRESIFLIVSRSVILPPLYSVSRSHIQLVALLHAVNLIEFVKARNDRIYAHRSGTVFIITDLVLRITVERELLPQVGVMLKNELLLILMSARFSLRVFLPLTL